MKRAPVFLVLVGILAAGCTHKIAFTDFDSGNVLEGQYNELSKIVTVTMPEGEILTGKYTAIRGASFGFGSSVGSTYVPAFAPGWTGYSMPTYSIMPIFSGNQNGEAHALLKSEKSNLMMDVHVAFDGNWPNNGYGEAETNDGRRYKVEF